MKKPPFFVSFYAEKKGEMTSIPPLLGYSDSVFLMPNIKRKIPDNSFGLLITTIFIYVHLLM